MESQIKSSFIPQDVGKQAPVMRRAGSGGGDLLVLGAIILLIASVALAAAVFLYSQYLTSSIASKQDSIDRARAAIEPALIEELARLDTRMRASDLLLQQHLAPSVIFDLLEQVTLQSIALSEFTLLSEGVDVLKVTMKGKAQSVNSIALQSDLYGRSGIITSPIFSDINRGSDGLMQFRVDAILNLGAMRYVRLVQAGSGGAPVEQQVVLPIETTTPPEGPSFTPVQ